LALKFIPDGPEMPKNPMTTRAVQRKTPANDETPVHDAEDAKGAIGVWMHALRQQLEAARKWVYERECAFCDFPSSFLWCSCIPREARPERRARGSAVKQEMWLGGCSASIFRS
jgi:hypothetical protein